MLSLRLAKTSVALVAALAAVGLGAARAAACGTGGYSYAGLAAPSHAFGIAATVTRLGEFNLLAGHIAGWVGVGGPGLGPKGSDEWLQVGLSSVPGSSGSDLYYEETRPGTAPTYHPIAVNLPLGKPARVAVLEMHGRPDVWRIWLDGAPVSAPIYLPASHGRWAPIATAEAWDGGTGTCNGFLYRFGGVAVATAPGGGWRSLVGGYRITSPTTQVAQRQRHASFLAAGGADAERTLASFIP